MISDENKILYNSIPALKILKDALEKFPKNQFVQSCKEFLLKRGFLSDKQKEALLNIKENNSNHKKSWSYFSNNKKEKENKSEYEQYSIDEEDYYDDNGNKIGTSAWVKNNTGGRTFTVYKNGRTISYFGGPCGPLVTDENGEEC